MTPYRLPAEWLDSVRMSRVILHWTAGAHTANAVDRRAYHFIVEGNGTVVQGTHRIRDNVSAADGVYARHTAGLNTGSIGVAMACMAGAKEHPFNAGRFPMTSAQWGRAAEVVARLCEFYSIPVTPKTVLSHAEVQSTLGVRQSAKWDVTRLPFDLSLRGAKHCGDRFRELAQAARVGA